MRTTVIGVVCLLLVALTATATAASHKKKKSSRFYWRKPRYVMPWLKGPNVCAVEEVMGTRKRYYSECMAFRPRNVCGRPTFIRYHCCTGYEVVPGAEGCQGVTPVENLLQTAKHLFLRDFRKQTKISPEVTNMLNHDGAYTLFAPENSAFNTMSADTRDRLSEKTPQDNLLSYHMVHDRYYSQDLRNDMELTTLYRGQTSSQGNATLHVNRYSNGIVTVNCVRVVLPNQPATNGILHVVEKVLEPLDQESQTSVMEKVLYDENLGEFVTALVLTDFAKELRSGDKAFTIFAPTDEAFRRAPPDLISRVLKDSKLVTKLLKYHILDRSICTSAILGPTSLTTMEGQKINLTCDSTHGLLINGVPLSEKDGATHNGVVHNIDELLIPDSVKTIQEKLTELGLHEFVEFTQGAGISSVMTELGGNHTVLAPSVEAFANLTSEQRRLLQNSAEAARRVFNYHVLPGHVTTRQMIGDQSFMAYGSTGSINAHSNMKVYNREFGVNDARITSADHEVANGVIHVIDKVLWPPEGLLIDKIREDPKLKTFLSLMQMSSLSEMLQREEKHYTVFAPSDDAFEAMETSVLESLMRNQDVLTQFLRNHMVHSPTFLRTLQDKWRSRFKTLEGEWIEVKRKSHGAPVIINDQVKVTESDIQATNGVLHKVDTVFACTCIERFLNEVF